MIFEVLFLRNLACAAEFPQALKPYAPWIQYAIEQFTGKRFLCRHKPKTYIPPVRDTLQIIKDIGKGKPPVVPEENASPQEPKVKQETIQIPHDENPTLYEICLWTQQSQERHIKMDTKEKVHLAIEINHLHNTARQALLVVKEEKKRSRVLLPKLYTKEQLKAKGIEKEYDYIDTFETDCMRKPV